MLWRSNTWSRRDKMLGTIVVPGGLMLPAYIASVGSGAKSCAGSGGPTVPTIVSCHGGGSFLAGGVAIVILVFLTLVQLASSGRLYWAGRLRT